MQSWNVEGNGRIDMIVYNEEIKAFQNAGYVMNVIIALLYLD